MFSNFYPHSPLPLNYYTWIIVPHNHFLKNESNVLNFGIQNQNVPKEQFCAIESQATEKQLNMIGKNKVNNEKEDEKSADSKPNEKKIPKKIFHQSDPVGDKKDQQFVPNVPQVRKVRRTPQNANRNVIPNIMHQIIAFLFKKSRSSSLVDQLIRKHDVKGCSIKRFYTYAALMKEKMNNYVNADALLILNELQEPQFEIYSEEQQIFYIKICRILVNYYFDNQFDIINLTSKRMKSDKRVEHLKMKRILLENFKEFLIQ